MKLNMNQLKQFGVLITAIAATNACSLTAHDTSSEMNTQSTTINKSEFKQHKHPSLVNNASDVVAMRAALLTDGQFKTEFLKVKKAIDAELEKEIIVPQPKDAGGGYTHEKHKKNYLNMHKAGMLYQLTQDKKYADYVANMLFKYADMYPTLPHHPEEKNQAPGKLFWQSLNEAVWLIHSIQAYDNIMPALTRAEQIRIEQGVFRPMALFLSEESPQTFDRVHNHGTWATAAVGMTGYVLNEDEWVEKALLGLDKSGKGGFLRQLTELFSPDGYYNEGPYYQRYALMPFVTFAKAIQVNQPERKIFKYRDGILLKAIHTTVQLSYNDLFFPINDAIKDKGIDTIELVNGVALAYGLTGDTGLLDIAQQQNTILLTGDGLKVAQGLDKGLATPYQFNSMVFRDGAKGDEGAFVVMRDTSGSNNQALAFKATAQGLGHGHFDKLSYLFYDKGAEVISDYGAARFLNVEAKFGGRYLPENKTYANQTIAHNTLVVDETSHFAASYDVGNQNHPELLFFAQDQQVKISSAKITTAYQDVDFVRTMALINTKTLENPIVVDVLSVDAKQAHQYDLPTQYKGHFTESNFALNSQTNELKPLGQDYGYQHIWLKAKAKPTTDLIKLTWLHDSGRFYTYSAINSNDSQVLFTQIGANDANFNLRNENAFIIRVPNAKKHNFVSVLEPHGEYNPSKEYTLNATSNVKQLSYQKQAEVELVNIEFNQGDKLLLAFNKTAAQTKTQSKFTWNGKDYQFSGSFKLIELTNQ